MSRIAEARARAGKALPLDDATKWNNDQEAGDTLLSGVAPKPVSPFSAAAPKPVPRVEQRVAELLPQREAPAEYTIADLPPRGEPDPEPPAAHAHRTPVPGARPRLPQSPLAAMVRRVFLSKQHVRSVLFCTPPGDPVGAVAWHTAELIAAQSGKRVAFVEDAAASRVSPHRARVNPLITRVGWYADEADAAKASRPRQSSEPAVAASDGVLGRNVSDLYSSFDFVVVNATAPAADDLIPLAREVEATIVVVAELKTRRADAEMLVDTLRDGGAYLLGVVLISRASETSDSLFNFNG